MQQQDKPSLALFVRRLVGIDRKAAQALFADYLEDTSLSSQQIRFIELIIDQLTANGIVQKTALFDAPFNHLHAGEPVALFAGKEKVINAIFTKLDEIEASIKTMASL